MLLKLHSADQVINWRVGTAIVCVSACVRLAECVHALQVGEPTVISLLLLTGVF